MWPGRQWQVGRQTAALCSVCVCWHIVKLLPNCRQGSIRPVCQSMLICEGWTHTVSCQPVGASPWEAGGCSSNCCLKEASLNLLGRRVFLCRWCVETRLYILHGCGSCYKFFLSTLLSFASIPLTHAKLSRAVQYEFGSRLVEYFFELFTSWKKAVWHLKGF